MQKNINCNNLDYFVQSIEKCEGLNINERAFKTARNNILPPKRRLIY